LWTTEKKERSWKKREALVEVHCVVMAGERGT